MRIVLMGRRYRESWFYCNIMKWDLKIDMYLSENSMDIIYNFKYQGELLLSTKKIIAFAASTISCVSLSLNIVTLCLYDSHTDHSIVPL